jgi:outer membrane protein
LTLQEAVTLVPNSASWRAADRGVAAAARGLDAARGAALLNVTAGADYSRTGVTSSADPILNGVVANLSLSASVSTSVLPWSPAFDAVRSAERTLQRAELDRLEARANITLGVVEGYFSAKQAQTDFELARATAALFERRVAIVKAQNSSGTANADAVRTTEQANLSAQSAVKQAELAANLARRSLLNTLGQPDAAIQFSSATPAPRALESVDALLKSAAQKRLDVRRALIAILELEDAINVASRERWLPQASLNLSVGGVSADGKPTGNSATASLNVGQGSLGVNGSYAPIGPAGAGASLTLSATIQVPIIAPGADARIEATRANLDSAKANLESVRLNAEIDVRRKHLDAQIAQDQLEIQNANAAVINARALDTEARFKAGLVIELEVQNAGLEVRRAERDVEAARVNAFLAGLKLENAAFGMVDLAKIRF